MYWNRVARGVECWMNGCNGGGGSKKGRDDGGKRRKEKLSVMRSRSWTS